MSKMEFSPRLIKASNDVEVDYLINANEMALCGEVFLTNTTSFLFICTFCNKQFLDARDFTNHLEITHLSNLNEAEEVMATDSDQDDHVQKEIEKHSQSVKQENQPKWFNDDNFSYIVEMIKSIDDGDDETNSHDPDVVKEEYMEGVNIEGLSTEPTANILDVFENVEHLEEDEPKEPLSSDLLATFEVLENSFESESEANVYTCQICVKSFGTQIEVDAHQMSHASGEKLFICDECGLKFVSAQSMSSHKLRHKNPRKHKCEYCGQDFTKLTELREHVSCHSKKDVHELNSHVDIELMVEGNNSGNESNDESYYLSNSAKDDGKHPCDSCGARVKNLEKHMSIHRNDSKHKCKICDKSFRTKYTLDGHMLVHGDEKPFKCDICGIGFKNKANLSVHLRRHAGIKPHQCQVCKKRYSTTTELKIHMRTHTGERPYICDECGQTFITSSSLAAHRLRHQNLRRHACEHCDRKFFSLGELRDHSVSHTGERNYVCDICNSTFSKSYNLRIHKKIHSKIKKYECKKCSKRFAQPGGLYAHSKSCHSL